MKAILNKLTIDQLFGESGELLDCQLVQDGLHLPEHTLIIIVLAGLLLNHPRALRVLELRKVFLLSSPFVSATAAALGPVATAAHAARRSLVPELRTPIVVVVRLVCVCKA